MKRIIVLVLLLFNCADRQTTETERLQAMNCYKECNKVAEQWFGEFDKYGYGYFLKKGMPGPFIKKYKGREKELEKDLTQWADTNEKVFGRVKERKFIGVHVWYGGKLLTWAPNVEKKILDRIRKPEVKDRFCEIDTRYMGLGRASDMFRNFPAGNYVLLMYKAVPTRKSTAEELLIVWQNPAGAWQVASYKIADDI
jgi:hypothetical protein